MRQVSHVDDIASDPGAALFAGLRALPKVIARQYPDRRRAGPLHQLASETVPRGRLPSGTFAFAVPVSFLGS
jgi:hypothetical protein